MSHDPIVNFIGGTWQAASSGRKTLNHNPATGDRFGPQNILGQRIQVNRCGLVWLAHRVEENRLEIISGVQVILPLIVNNSQFPQSPFILGWRQGLVNATDRQAGQRLIA